MADAQAERDDTLYEVARLENSVFTLSDQVLKADKERRRKSPCNNIKQN